MVDKNDNLNPQVCKIEIVPIGDVSAINFGADRTYRVVTLKSQKSWLEIYFTPGKATYEEEFIEDAAGSAWNQKLEFLYPGEDSDTLNALFNYPSNKWCVKLTFNSALVKLIGDLDNPCLLKKSFSTEKGGHVLSIFRKSSLPALNTT